MGFVTALLALLAPAGRSAAEIGPALAPEREYAGRLEGRYDYDKYTFYVVAADTATTHLSLATPAPPGIEVVRAIIADAHGTDLGELGAPHPGGEPGQIDLRLPTGRYTVTVATTFVGFTEDYTLTTGPGQGGAFFPGEEVSGRCAAAEAKFAAAQVCTPVPIATHCVTHGSRANRGAACCDRRGAAARGAA